jgi:hypothetical protein
MIEFRSLHHHELDQWFKHVASVFTCGEEYFRRHWFSDPDRVRGHMAALCLLQHWCAILMMAQRNDRISRVSE